MRRKSHSSGSASIECRGGIFESEGHNDSTSYTKHSLDDFNFKGLMQMDRAGNNPCEIDHRITFYPLLAKNTRRPQNMLPENVRSYSLFVT